ncbi:MAG: molecular chaperone TorD family protein [Chromatiaceae bacterium]|nr:molecular chaperone TorD family protein [Chromatiaceae bacterium]MCP5436334.1 molecular chaperone TorD family protein [Chromatiaceae bacterium]MCP5438887.1 molecular chaperone TorD family protein [Chromatiaceae bacterium]
MTAGATRWSSGDGDLGQLRHTLARDLMVLAELHAKAPRRDTLSALWRRCYDGVLGFKLSSDGGRKAVGLFCEGLTDIPTCLDRETLARLESAYRELYLNEESGAFPFESAWCGDAASGERNAIDGIYAWQRRSGFVDEVGSYRCADHLVGQLRLLAHLVSPAGASMPFADIGLFLDQHLLCWVERFAARVSLISTIRWYQGIAALTAAYIVDLRALAGRLNDQASARLQSPEWAMACVRSDALAQPAVPPVEQKTV